jgi:hypothetical protein
MVPVDRFGAHALLGEEMLRVEPRQDRLRPCSAGERLCHPRRHGRQERRGEEKRLDLGARLSEHLAGEVIECSLVRKRGKPAILEIRRAQALGHEHDTGDPSLGLRVDPRQELGREPVPSLDARDLDGLGGRETELVGADEREPVLGPQRRERRRRDFSADDDGADALGQDGEPLTEHVVQLRFIGHAVVVVEDEDEGGLEAREQTLEVSQSEDGEASTVLGREQGKKRAPARRRAGGSERHVVEERRDVDVALVDAVPEAAQLALVDVVRDQRGLPRARRSGHPDDGMGATGVEPLEEPGSRQDAADSRASDLGQWLVCSRHGRSFAESSLGPLRARRQASRPPASSARWR